MGLQWAPDRLTDADIRTLILSTLEREPEATADRVAARAHVRLGRSLDEDETRRITNIYVGDGHAESASRVGFERAVREAHAASLGQSRPNVTELVGLVAGVLPLFVHLQSTSVSKGNVASYVDVIAIIGGFVALGAGFVGLQRMPGGAQRLFHVGLVASVLLLGLYQTLLGLGFLHKAGIYQFS